MLDSESHLDYDALKGVGFGLTQRSEKMDGRVSRANGDGGEFTQRAKDTEVVAGPVRSYKDNGLAWLSKKLELPRESHVEFIQSSYLEVDPTLW